MKRLVWGAFWLLVFLATGVIFGALLFQALAHRAQHLTRWTALTCLIAGGLSGLALFFAAFWRRWLPGLRPARAGVDWDWGQAVILVAGFFIMQALGSFLCAEAIGFVVNLVSGLTAAIARLPFERVATPNLVAPAVAGYLTASLWCLWYIGRLGPARLRDAAATGIAWRPAPARAYAVASIFALLIVAVVIGFYYFIPPDAHALDDSQMAKVFGRPGWPILILVLLAVFIAPPVEEFLFRGGVFSALALRLGPVWAGILTTLLFMAVHAPEKIGYPLGFIDVGLMAAAAAWLRVRYGSIRPGILLHVLYNAGGIFAAGLLNYLA
jgi:membrane protease YdiL (CAAX protease family)